MSKKFYIQFVGEDKYWQNSFIQEDNISLEEFRANILPPVAKSPSLQPWG